MMGRTFSILAAFVLTGCQPLMQSMSGQSANPAAVLNAEFAHGPRINVKIPSRNANADLVLVAINDEVNTWLAVDSISVSFRNGIVIASRGLGFDLMAADAQQTLDALNGPGEGVYRRKMRYLTGDNHSTYLNAGCTMAEIGAEAINGQALFRFEETCKARNSEFKNTFWTDDRGTIQQSRQWISTNIGYIEVRNLQQ